MLVVHVVQPILSFLLWIGSFLSSLIFRIDGDDEAAERLTLLELLVDLQGGPPAVAAPVVDENQENENDEVDDNNDGHEVDDNDETDNDTTTTQPPNINWEVMIRRLRRHPEEAAAYCHSIDASPLLRCLQLPYSVPARVIHALLDAYEDAVFHSDRHGTTPLLAVMMMMMMSTNNNDNHDDEQEEHDALTNKREIARVLLKANPEAVRQSDRKGRLPLHYLRSDLAVARDLIQGFPDAVDHVDKVMGRLPLHYFCCLNSNQGLQSPSSREQQQQQPEDDPQDENHLSRRQSSTLSLQDPAVARLLLETANTRGLDNPVLRKDKVGFTPLDILYKELTTVLDKVGEKKQTTNENHAKTVDTLWDILTILVQSAAMKDTSTSTKFQMVHALVALQCPAMVMKEALRRDPQQAVERDTQGRTPLLMAVEWLDCNAADSSTTTATTSTTTTHLPTQPRRTTPKQQQPQQSDDSIRAAAVCVELIHCNRAAARMMDREGRLAIDLLSEKGFYHEELFEALVNAEPRAVITRDLKNKQHPFLTAALAPSGRSNVASVYHLLRAEPHVIQFFLGDTK